MEQFLKDILSLKLVDAKIVKEVETVGGAALYAATLGSLQLQFEVYRSTLMIAIVGPHSFPKDTHCFILEGLPVLNGSLLLGCFVLSPEGKLWLKGHLVFEKTSTTSITEAVPQAIELLIATWEENYPKLVDLYVGS